MESEKLVEAVRSLDCLWNVKSPGYKDKRRPENALKKESSVVSFSKLSLSEKFITNNKTDIQLLK